MSLFLIALGLSLLGGLGGLFVASSVLLFKDSSRARLVPWLVSYAVGAMLGVSMLSVLPEALQRLPAQRVFATLLGGILLFFAVTAWRDLNGFTAAAQSHSTLVTSYLYDLGGVSLAIGAFLFPGILFLVQAWRMLKATKPAAGRSRKRLFRRQ